MLLETLYGHVEVERREKIIIVRFLSPHRIISTCRCDGGISEEKTYIYNHQGCEPHGRHMKSFPGTNPLEPSEFRRFVCERHGLPPEECATLGTAANMNNAAVVSERFRELEVAAVVTGGVETNAGRAGDPASCYEHDGVYESLNQEALPQEGTINTIVCINKELTSGALVRTVMTAAEAKTAALQELAVNSRYSDGLATGTGTDQIAVACMLGTGVPLAGAGKHVKLGELIGRVVKTAVKKALELQNEMTPLSRCSSLVHVERFGTDETRMIEGIQGFLDAESARLLKENFSEIERDAVTVAAVAALVHLKDKLTWGVLPQGCAQEIMITYAGQIAATVSGKPEDAASFRGTLGSEKIILDNPGFLRLVFRAFALGFSNKWK